MSYTINKNLVYSTLGVPPAAVNIHGVCEVEIDDFRDEDGNILTNTARKVDVADVVLAKWTTIHKNNKYDDTMHCPPTYKNCPMTGKELVTGHCKTKGADGAGKTSIRAIEVSFNNYDGVSAADWEKIGRSNENRPLEDNPNYVKSDRNFDDLVDTLMQMKDNISFYVMNENGEKVTTDKYVNKALKRLLLPESQWPKIRDLFYVELGVNPDNVVGRTVTGDKTAEANFKDCVKKIYPNKKILYKTLDAQGSGSVKYNIELIRLVVNAYVEGKPYDMVIAKHTRMKSANMIHTARKRDRKFFTNPEGIFQQDMKMWMKTLGGTLLDDNCWPEVKFEPQFDTEIKEWNDKEKLV